MALKKFTIGEMFSVTQPWVAAGNPERLLLESLPGMASLMRFVELAHGGLIASQSRAEAARLAALTGELGALQGRHATHARFGAGILTAYRGLHGGTDAGASLACKHHEGRRDDSVRPASIGDDARRDLTVLGSTRHGI